MIDWKEKLTQIQQWVKDDRKLRLMMIVGFSLILLLFLWGLFPESDEQVPVTSIQTQSLEEYKQALQDQTETLLQAVDGVGELSVMITLEGDYQVIYQTDNSSKTEEKNSDDEQEQSTESTDTIAYQGDEALVQTTITPQVLGVAVVCQGGDQVAVQQRVIDIVTTLFNLSSTKVTVVVGYTE